MLVCAAFSGGAGASDAGAHYGQGRQEQTNLHEVFSQRGVDGLIGPPG